MRGSQRKQLRQQFRPHLYPVKTFRGDPTRPAYTLYSLWDYPTYLAAANELEELVDQWPQNQARTIALLAVYAAFFENGAPHWAEQLVWEEDQHNIHALMLYERRWARRNNPTLAGRYAQHLALAEAARAESQRRKQGPPTGSRRLPSCRGRVKKLLLPKQAVNYPTRHTSLALKQVVDLIQAARLDSLPR